MQTSDGIIPARAGFTLTLLVTTCQPPGSSPLARGLHFLTPKEVASVRIIPARAGFTAHPGRLS